MKDFFKSVLNHFKKIPWYGWLIGIGLLAFQLGTYWLTNAISNAIGTADRAFLPKIAAIDDLIPLVPFFVIFYWYSYVYWIEAYANASSYGKRKTINIIVGAMLAYLFGIVIYLSLPTYMDRVAEGLIEKTSQPGLFNKLTYGIYKNDGLERAYNLFPSFHCLVSTYCFMTCVFEKETSKGYKIYSGIMASAICLSTLFIKQHYIIDVVVGILLGVGFYFLGKYVNIGGKIIKDKSQELSKEEE